MRLKACIYVLILALLGAANAGANILVNGDFSLSPDPGLVQRYLGGSSLVGWFALNDDVELMGPDYWQSAPGSSRSVDLAGLHPGGIGQSIPTVVGGVYTLSFYLAGNMDSAPAVKYLTIATVSNAAVFDSQSFTFDTTGYSHSNMGWTLETWQFTAIAPRTDILFIDSTITEMNPHNMDVLWNPAGPVVANINLTGPGDSPDPSPEPLSFVLLGSGLIGIACVYRRRARR